MNKKSDQLVAFFYDRVLIKFSIRLILSSFPIKYIISKTSGPCKAPTKAKRKGIITLPKPISLEVIQPLIFVCRFSTVKSSMEEIIERSSFINSGDSSFHAFLTAFSSKSEGVSKKYCPEAQISVTKVARSVIKWITMDM